jgi:hypothetical protein
MTYSAFSQVDSVLFMYKYQRDVPSRMLYDLLNIQYISAVCADTNLRGKHFFLTVDEYKEGKLVNHDDLQIKERVDTIPEVTGKGDTLKHIIDWGRLCLFDTYFKEVSINLMGQFQNDSMKLLLNYLGVVRQGVLECKEDFLLRAVNQCGASDSFYIPTNKEVPIFVFTSPFKIKGDDGVVRYGDYCILGTQNIKDWYKLFKIEHYYVFNLLIK